MWEGFETAIHPCGKTAGYSGRWRDKFGHAPTPIMFYVYILKSIKDGDLYTGSTNDLKKRFWEHNKGLVKSTNPRRPFRLIYYEAYSAEKDARLRESRLKQRSRALAQLKNRIENSLKT